ncbi:AAA family ATPase [Candidatus Woesearchaeota archaeon]|nr:AAA family ATPase [Candidatus Woesearchaeota archaeon]
MYVHRNYDELPRLVVMCGYPCSGKSEVASHLARLGFRWVSTDQLRYELYGVLDFSDYSKRPDYERLENDMLWLLHSMKLSNLGKGLDVVVDSCAETNEMREWLLDTGGCVAEKYLICLDVEKDILRKRNYRKRRINDVVGEVDSRWERMETFDREDSEVYVYTNNRPEELVRILRDMDSLFRLRRGLWLPV